ncbi:MAG: hypothetical protein U0903_00080 [Planctomycetales bacterium]
MPPDNAAILIDHATALMRFKRDVITAKAILSRVDTDVLVEVAKPYYNVVLGLISLDERDSYLALKYFQQALSGITPYMNANPNAEQFADVVHGYLALAYAQGGDLQAGREHFRIAEPRLRIFTLQDLTQRCEKAGLHR